MTPNSEAASSAGDNRVWWPAPAKLNLFLQVVGRRADGYHDLQTAFQLVDLCDRLAFEPDPQGQIQRLEGPEAIPPATDLAVRAAETLRATAQAEGLGDLAAATGARLYIRKRIPWGGGLGGGSSDAATALKVLNLVWNIGYSDAKLAEIGLKLGADVPVFVHGSTAFGEGLGDKLSPLELPESWFLIIHPGIAVSTAAVFQAPELTRNSPLLTIPGFLASGGRNDCEPVVRARFPQVAEALDWLGSHAPARLTGTGSCIFARFDSAAAAERIAARVPEQSGWKVWVVRGLTRSPLEERLRWGVAKW